MHTLDLEHTRAILPFDELIQAIEEGFRGNYESPLRHQHQLANSNDEDDILLLMPAWRDKHFCGIKLVNVVPRNSKQQKPAISSIYVLFDRETGEYLLSLDGGELTARRTAAASALAARMLARHDSSIHLIVGAGRVGQNIPLAYREVLPITKTLVFDINADNANKAVENLQKLGIEAAVISDLEQAAQQADIITCATLASSPVLKGIWLKPGQHIDLIGSFTPKMREADDEVVRRAKIFIDTEDALAESGDIITPLENGTISRSDIVGTLESFFRSGISYQRKAEDITLFKAVGSAIEDLSSAEVAYRKI